MKLKKRSSGAPEPDAQEPPQNAKNTGGKKPVIVYIMILFIVAFIMMAVSFVMHQRSNTEVIGKLQDSVTALKEVQAVQDENIQLREKLDTAQGKADALQQQLEDAKNSVKSAQSQAAAMTALYTLQQQYSARDYDACKSTVTSMENQGLDKLLPAEISSGVTTPAQRYLQLREAVENKSK